MKHIKIPYIETLNNIDFDIESNILEDWGVNDAIEHANWPVSFPYKPITIFYIARSNKSIFIKFNVRGNVLKASHSTDQQPVNEDSCVEFFCKLPQNNYYTNFEFNCIGTCAASKRKDRNTDVSKFSLSDMKEIKRYPSIGKRAFNEMEGNFEWDLAVEIPFDLMGIDPNNLPEKIMANFYKCADKTECPHFVSWNPITSEKPDFHRPEFFGEIYF